MRSPPPVPPLRDDLRPKKLGGKLVVEDPVRRVRVPIDDLTLQLMECLAEGPMSQDDLATELGAPRVELQRRVRMLSQQLLLQTPRSAAVLEVTRAAATAPTMDAQTVALGFHPELRHGCVACGACCHGTDVGPLKDDDVAKVMAHDWTAHLPGVAPDEWIDEVQGPGGQGIRLMGHRNGRCVFLGEDKLCVLHKVAGADHKPTICRQFPFTFTRTPKGVDVSFTMECRAWWTAKQNGKPAVDDAPAVRALLAEGAPVVQLPVPVPIATGLEWDAETWEAVRADALRRIDAATDHAALVRAVVESVRGPVTRAHEHFAGSEVFAEREAWGVPMPDSVDHSARFFETVKRLDEALARGLTAIGDEMAGRGAHDEVDRIQRLRWSTRALLAGRRAEDLLRFAHEHELWQDMARASFQSHEVVRRGGLVQGTATLVLRLLAGQLLSGLLAQVGLRGRTSEQDVTDALVLVTKMWRGSASERLLASVRADLAQVFFWNADVLAFGDAPKVLPTWAD